MASTDLTGFRMKLIDRFGSAKDFSENTTSSTVTGSPLLNLASRILKI
jgi:hypothetical protein